MTVTLLAVVLALAAFVPVRDAAPVRECEEGADGQCRAPTGGRGGPAKDQVLLQTAGAHAEGLSKSAAAAEEAEAAAVARDEAVALHVQQLWRSSDEVSEALKRGVEAMRSALPSMTKENPSMDEVMTTLGRSLSEAIRPLLPEAERDSAAFRSFAEHCVTELVDLGKEAKMRSALTDFNEQAEVSSLLTLLTTTLETVHYVAARDFMRGTALEIGRYLASLGDLLEGTGTSVDLIESGEKYGSVESLAYGMRTALDDLVPEQDRSEVAYKQVAIKIDPKLGEFVDKVLQFARSLTSMNVCWKRSIKRDAIRPDQCSEGYFLNKLGWCMPVNGRGLIKLARCGADRQAWGRWCLGPCADGFRPWVRHCKQLCGGKYYVDSPLLCGNKKGAIAKALFVILVKIGIAAATKTNLFSIAISGGFLLVSSMTTVFSAYERFFKPFGHHYCKPEDTAEEGARGLGEEEEEEDWFDTPALPGNRPTA